eukprot:151222_1
MPKYLKRRPKFYQSPDAFKYQNFKQTYQPKINEIFTAVKSEHSKDNESRNPTSCKVKASRNPTSRKLNESQQTLTQMDHPIKYIHAPLCTKH